MNDTVVALLIAVILGCIGIVNAIVVAKSKVDEEVMWAKFKFALDKYRKDNDVVSVQKSTLRSWVKNKKVEIAREIFEEIEKLTYSKCFSVRADRDVTGLIIDGEKFVELKKKYLGEDINAPTKESEGEG